MTANALARQHAMMMTSQNGQREQFKALLRKNYTLKRRGLWCCSLFELLVPAAFVALMCLPKALVPDEKNHDVLYRPFSIGAGWNALGQFANTPEIDADGTAMSFSDTSFSEGALKGSGWQFTFSPNTADASNISRRAYVNFLCADSRSENLDVKNVSYSVPRMVNMGWNKRALEEMVNESATDLEKKALSDAATLLLNNNTKEWREERCSDDCL